MRKNKHLFIAVTLLALSATACAGTMMKNYGSFALDEGIAQEFETYRLRPGVHYFVSGSDVYPNAILALKREYILEDTLWKGVDMTPKKLKEFVTGMQQKAHEVGMYLRGWSVRDEKGHEIGVWYSVLFATTSVKVEGNKVIIYRPPQHVYRENDDRDNRE